VTISTILLLEDLPKKPIVTLNQACEFLKLTKPPVIKALNILMECGILTEVTGKKKDKVYRYEQYLNILAEGTEL
jgi:Fic family protein